MTPFELLAAVDDELRRNDTSRSAQVRQRRLLESCRDRLAQQEAALREATEWLRGFHEPLMSSAAEAELVRDAHQLARRLEAASLAGAAARPGAEEPAG